MEKSNERKGMHIIESVVNMAKTMTIPVIVEGVETKEQCDYLMGLSIRYIQGYYFYKPMPAADFEKLISVKGNVDPDGFVFKANEEFRIREFLNDTVYTDSMLNHIIGPAAISAITARPGMSRKSPISSVMWSCSPALRPARSSSCCITTESIPLTLWRTGWKWSSGFPGSRCSRS